MSLPMWDVLIWMLPVWDGLIFVNTGEELMSGDFVRVKVTGAADYDLIGEIYDESAQ